MQSINNQNIDRGITICFSFSDADACIIEENGNKYLLFVLTAKNKKVIELYKKLWSEIKKQIKAINSGESTKYKKDFMKIRLDSYDDDLPLNKILCFSELDIIAESVFQIKNEYYPQIHINQCKYECEYYFYASKSQAFFCISYTKLLLFISYIKVLLSIIFVLLDKISIFISLINWKNEANKH